MFRYAIPEPESFSIGFTSQQKNIMKRKLLLRMKAHHTTHVTRADGTHRQRIPLPTINGSDDGLFLRERESDDGLV